jgi:hypothetical protein
MRRLPGPSSQEEDCNMPNTLPQSSDANNPFRRLWDLGFHRLVPVIPPGVEIADRSAIAARMRAGEDPRGKAPGIRHKDGRWGGMHFVAMESQEQDLDAWHAMGASVGVKTGQGLVAIDIDTTDRVAAELIYKLAQQHLGKACVRFGRSPKCLMLYQAPEDTPYRKVSFSTETETRAAVEMLTEGRQFVAIGTHPGTGKPYRWHENIIPERKAITQVQHADLDAFFSAVAAALPNAEAHASADDRNAPDQESLQAPSFERLEHLVRAMPNTSAMFPDRESYVKVAYAIKGATPDGYELAAQDMFLDWCEKWQGPNGETNDLDIALADWQRAKPPYRTGVRFLERHAVGLFFEAVEPDEVDDMFGAVEAAQQATRRRFELLTDDDLQTRPDPRWLIARHIPEDGIGLLYGDPGTGKSFTAQDMALTIATGAESWHGDMIAPSAGPVLYIAGEGAGDFKLRVKAWKTVNYAADQMIPADRFRVLIEPMNFMRKDDIEQLLQAVDQAGLGNLSLIVVDTVSRAAAGADENSQQDMSIFVQALDALRVKTGAFVLGVHHASKAGAMRGSTVLAGAADVVLHFDRKKGRKYGRLTCMKMKAGPDDVRDAYRLDVVDLGDGKSSLVPVRVEEQEAEEAVCNDEMQAQIMAAIDRDARAKNHWSMAPQSKSAGRKYAPDEVSRGWGVPLEVAKQWLDLWLGGPDPVLRVEIVDTDHKRRGIVLADKPIMDNVFG